jgi:hypothetical protein
MRISTSDYWIDSELIVRNNSTNCFSFQLTSSEHVCNERFAMCAKSKCGDLNKSNWVLVLPQRADVPPESAIKLDCR